MAKMLLYIVFSSMFIFASKNLESKIKSHKQEIAASAIRALKTDFKLQEGKYCQHIAHYENGQIVTHGGDVNNLTGNMWLNVTGEQTVSLDNLTSTSTNWEISKGYVVHHHEGFDVYTNKKKQFIALK